MQLACDWFLLSVSGSRSGPRSFLIKRVASSVMEAGDQIEDILCMLIISKL